MELAWKPNWEETKRHYIDWWNHTGLVIGMWGAPVVEGKNAAVAYPEKPATPNALYEDPVFKARHSHWTLSRQSFTGDLIPVSDTSVGPGSLATFLGSQPGFSPETIWYNPVFDKVEDPENLPPLKFDPENYWWKLAEATARECVTLGRGKYLTGFPDLIENFDILASLRGTQELLMDVAIRPEWVVQKIEEINQVWFEAYKRLYDIVKLDDGSSAFWAFYAWGPGKTAKVQCDASAMLSPDSFRQLVVPALSRQCEWLDHSVYHLDGHQCLCHLDALLEIPALDAIEWTPDPAVPTGGNLHWCSLYRRILDAGKSVQLLVASPDEVVPMLDAIGGKGVYILTTFESEKKIETICRDVEQYRK